MGRSVHYLRRRFDRSGAFLLSSFNRAVVEDGDFIVSFDLSEQIGQVRALLEKHQDQAMDMTDACIVRMSELFPDCKVVSVDHDFDVYRRFRNDPIPTVYPPDSE